MPNRLDRLLVLAAAALLVAISWDALARHRPAARTTAATVEQPPPEAPVPERIRLSGNYAVSGVAHARMLVPCGTVTVSGSGLSASGTIRCP
jgi:hypothetical protein